MQLVISTRKLPMLGLPAANASENRLAVINRVQSKLTCGSKQVDVADVIDAKHHCSLLTFSAPSCCCCCCCCQSQQPAER